MKRLILLIALLACTLPLSAQSSEKLEGEARSKAIATVLQANDLRTTLRFRFTQIRHSALLTEDLVSKGSAAFSFPDKVRWEVEQPRASVFVMNGLDAADRRQQTLMRNLSKLSGKGLINEEDFTVTVYSAPGQWQIDLVPLRRDLAQLFDRITLLTDPRSGALRSILLSEKTGDLTEIRLESMEKGVALSDELFQKP